MDVCTCRRSEAKGREGGRGRICAGMKNEEEKRNPKEDQMQLLTEKKKRTEGKTVVSVECK